MARLLGIAPLTHLELTPPEMVANAAQAGYDFLGLRLIPATPTEKHHFSLAEPSMMRETLQRLQDTPLKVLDIEIFRLQPGTDVTTYEAALAAGAMLGAKHALAAPQDTDPTRLADLLARFCELASQYGLGVDLEPTPWYEVRTLGECQQVIALTGRLDIGIVLDMIHFDRAGETAQAIQALPASYFRYAQLCDAPKLRPIDTEGLLFQARCERLMPGDGGLDLELARTLAGERRLQHLDALRDQAGVPQAAVLIIEQDQFAVSGNAGDAA